MHESVQVQARRTSPATDAGEAMRTCMRGFGRCKRASWTGIRMVSALFHDRTRMPAAMPRLDARQVSSRCRGPRDLRGNHCPCHAVLHMNIGVATDAGNVRLVDPEPEARTSAASPWKRASTWSSLYLPKSGPSAAAPRNPSRNCTDPSDSMQMKSSAGCARNHSTSPPSMRAILLVQSQQVLFARPHRGVDGVA